MLVLNTLECCLHQDHMAGEFSLLAQMVYNQAFSNSAVKRLSLLLVYLLAHDTSWSMVTKVVDDQSSEFSMESLMFASHLFNCNSVIYSEQIIPRSYQKSHQQIHTMEDQLGDLLKLADIIEERTEAIEAASPNVTESNNSHDSSGGCVLFALPHELRDQIYDDLIQDSHIEILRVSKKLHGEAIERLSLNGVCRMNVDPSRSVPQLILPKGIQNFNKANIRVSLKGQMSIRGLHRNIQPIRRLAISKINRQSCHIILEDHLDGHPYCCSTKTHPATQGVRTISDWHYLYLETLLNFRTVTLQIVNHNIGPVAKTLEPPSLDADGVYESRLLDFYSSVEDNLKVSLGPASWRSNSDRERRCLEFHPQNNLSSILLKTSSDFQRRLDRWSASIDDEDGLESWV